jgi:dTDP-4-dehydrorhamnose reductase
MRVVITGSKGQLGRALLETMKDHTLLPIDLPEHDFTKASTFQAMVDFAPEMVIHCGAFTHVDGCETDPDTAYRVNALGTQNVALACQTCGATMLYVSTNEVFDGTKKEPYLEFDPPNPIGVYGKSKLAGEMYVRALLKKFYIVRTAWLYARGGNNFVSKMIKAADERRALRVVADEISSPTYAPDLAATIAQLIQTGRYGIYHFTNEGTCSRYEFALKILELSGRGYIPITPITSDQYKRIAQPPLHTVIRNYYGATALGITLRPWEEALQEYFADEESSER